MCDRKVPLHGVTPIGNHKSAYRSRILFRNYFAV